MSLMKTGSDYGYWRVSIPDGKRSIAGSVIQHLYGVDKNLYHRIRDPFLFPDERIDTQNREIRKVNDILGYRSNEIFSDMQFLLGHDHNQITIKLPYGIIQNNVWSIDGSF